MKIETRYNARNFVEGSPVVPIFQAKIKNGVAPQGGLTLRISWLVTATGQTGGALNNSLAHIIPEGMNVAPTFIPSNTGFEDNIMNPCNKLVVMLESINPNVYRIAPYTRGQGFDYAVYADNDGANGDPPVLPDWCR